tara:strand:+ start:147 stop:1697 length:1551 start_codon:yes stop_codon:yes gene_type:complete
MGEAFKSWGTMTGNLYKNGDSYWTISKVPLSKVTLVLKDNPEYLLHSDYFIKTFNSELVETGMQKLVVKNYGDNTYLWKFVKVKDKFLAVFLEKDPEKNKKIISVSELNTENFELEEELVQLVKVDWDKSDTKIETPVYLDNSPTRSNDFLIITSLARLKANIRPLRDKGRPISNNLSMWVFDENFKLVNTLDEKTTDFNKSNGYFKIWTDVGPTGDIFSHYYTATIKEYSPGPFIHRQNMDYNSFVVTRTQKNGKTDVLRPKEDKPLFDCRVLNRPDGSLVLVGLNAEKIGDKYQATGLCTAEINEEDFSLESITDHPLDEELLNNVNDLRDPKLYQKKVNRRGKQQEISEKEKNTLSNVKRFAFIDINRNGTISILFEEYHSESSSYTDANGRIKTKTIYKYDDIIICTISNDITFDYIKKQEAYSDKARPYSLVPQISPNGELQFQTLESVIRVPANGENMKTASNPSILELSVGKKTKKFVLAETIFLDSNEVMTLYRKFIKLAWVRTTIED